MKNKVKVVSEHKKTTPVDVYVCPAKWVRIKYTLFIKKTPHLYKKLAYKKNNTIES